METLKIEIPKGFEVESFDKSKGEIKFREKPKSVLERIQTIEDVLTDNGLTKKGFYTSCESLEEDEIAYRLMKLICKTFNEGWTPDWSDSSQYKYFQYFYMNEGSSGFRYYDYGTWHSYSYVGSRLCFKSSELAKHTAEKFKDVYEQFHL